MHDGGKKVSHSFKRKWVCCVFTIYQWMGDYPVFLTFLASRGGTCCGFRLLPLRFNKLGVSLNSAFVPGRVFFGAASPFFGDAFSDEIYSHNIFFQNWTFFCHELKPGSPILQIRRWYKISDRGNPTTVQRRSLDQSSWTEQEQLVHYAKVLAEAFLIWSCLPLVSCLPTVSTIWQILGHHPVLTILTTSY